jgi:phospholipid/cholesterol/gamma-HCH transport system ATP-binding protein
MPLMSTKPQVQTARATNAEAAPIIRLEKLYKSFGSLKVLAGVSLALRKGETTVIIGESGSGKSVLLKHIVALLRPDRGQVFFHEQRIDSLPERELVKLRTRFGFLFQNSALFDSLTVAQNIAFPLVEHSRKSRKEIDQVVRDKLRMVGLDGVQAKRPAELSGGQRKRVALARAIAMDPEVVLYDEPTTGLDPPRADVINELILKLKHELGVTSAIVTHDLTSAFKVADRIAMLYQGDFIFDGTVEQVKTTRDQRVRRFIEGRATEEDLASLHDAMEDTRTGKR